MCYSVARPYQHTAPTRRLLRKHISEFGYTGNSSKAKPQCYSTLHFSAGRGTWLRLQNTIYLFFELFPLQSLPFPFLCSQAIKKMLHFSLSFCIPERKKQQMVTFRWFLPFSYLTGSSSEPHQPLATVSSSKEGQTGAGSAVNAVPPSPPRCTQAPSPFHDLRELHPSQELIVLSDFPYGTFELPLVLVDQPLPLLLLLTAALFPSKLKATTAKQTMLRGQVSLSPAVSQSLRLWLLPGLLWNC